MQLGFMIFVKYHIFIKKETFCEWLMANNQPSFVFPSKKVQNGANPGTAAIQGLIFGYCLRRSLIGAALRLEVEFV